jgi:hypothetical protein
VINLWKIYAKRQAHALRADNNCYYFYNDLDFRICPKNATTSIKKVIEYSIKDKCWNDLMPNLNSAMLVIGQVKPARIVSVNTHMDYMNIPFRRNSFKVAIKRDPVERFISAVTYLQKQIPDKIEKTTRLFSKTVDYRKHTLEEILTGVEEGWVNDIHLVPQSYYLGKYNQYDKVYSLGETGDFIKFLINYRQNPVLNDNKRYLNIHLNKTTPIEISSFLEKRIKKLYERDYDEGWY